MLSLIPHFRFPLFPSNSLSTTPSLSFPRRFFSPSLSSSSFIAYSLSPQDEDNDELVIGDCIVFEEGVFEDPFLRDNVDTQKPRSKKSTTTIETENLVPDKWKVVKAEINISKKERRRIAHEMEFGSRVEKKKKGLVPLRGVDEYLSYREAKLAQLKPVDLDNPTEYPLKEELGEDKNIAELAEGEMRCSSSARVAPRNPRKAVYVGSLDAITEFFNSGNYEPGDNASNKSEVGHRKLFSREERVLLNKRIPNLPDATSGKWLPLHTLAASGEFYLMDALLKHNVDINAADKDGLTALHKAVMCKKLAITNYLLRESANPFVRDKEGATLMHYAVRTASSQAIKILLLYNVDINLPDNDGWTPLHLAVQTHRTDLVRLLLIKGADKTLRNQDGLTPLDLCLYSGKDVRTYELIKLLKLLPKPR